MPTAQLALGAQRTDWQRASQAARRYSAAATLTTGETQVGPAMAGQQPPAVAGSKYGDATQSASTVQLVGSAGATGRLSAGGDPAHATASAATAIALCLQVIVRRAYQALRQVVVIG